MATIGVHGWTLDGFLAALRAEGATRVLDVRQRRGLRGSEYSWANAARLQAALADSRIGYTHVKELAPTTELRELQYAEDEKSGVGKRLRSQLGPEYVSRYTEEILDRVDLEPVVAELPAALLCVELEPAACHRSLIAARLAAEHGVSVTHLRPG